MKLEYVPRSSIIHNLHPLTKLAWAVVVLVLSFLFSDPYYLAAVLLSVLLVAAFGKVLREALQYLAVMIVVSVIIFLFQVLFRTEGHVLFTVFPAAWPVVGGWLPITDQGVRFGIEICLRVLCIVTVFPTILLTTQTRDIAMALVESLRVPYDYAFMFTAALRFIPVIMAEVSTISQAQRSRAYAVEGWNPIRKIRAFAPIAVPIVMIGIEKATRLGLGMDLRGYGSKGRTYLRQLKLGPADWIALALLAGLTVAGIAAAILGYGGRA